MNNYFSPNIPLFLGLCDFGIDENCPPDSGIGVFLDPRTNWWLDEDGFEHQDLKDFGFSALQQSTIRATITKNPGQEYLCAINNNRDLVEIFWTDKVPEMVPSTKPYSERRK